MNSTSQPVPPPPADRSKSFLLASVVVTIALFYVPYGRQIGFPLVLVSTVAHEMGHALTAVLVGGRVDSVEIFLSGGGLAHTLHGGRVAGALVSAGGLVGPAIAAALCFAFARSARVARFTLLFLGALLLLSVLFWVRNPFGVVYVLALAGALLVIGWRARAEIAQLVLVFVAVQLSLSVYSRGDYLFSDVANVGGRQFPSDVASMSEALVLPYWFWGGICAAFSAIVLMVGWWLFWRTGPLFTLRRSDGRATTSAPSSDP